MSAICRWEKLLDMNCPDAHVDKAYIALAGLYGMNGFIWYVNIFY